MSSTKAEVVAEGILVFALFEQLRIFQRDDGSLARGNATPDIMQDGIVAKFDPETDGIRNGNLEGGISVANVTGLIAYFPEFYRVKFMDDSQATITIMASGKSQGMRHASWTQPVSFIGG